MEPTDTLTTIFSHNLWANLRLLDACGGLSDGQLNTSLSGTFGTIQKTFQHIVLAERGYLSRISTGQRYHHPKDAPSMTLAEMKASVQETGKELIEWAQTVQAKDEVFVNWDDQQRGVPKTIILNQVVNHATEHRAQIMVIMTQLGIEPPDLDSWTYFDELNKISY